MRRPGLTALASLVLAIEAWTQADPRGAGFTGWTDLREWDKAFGAAGQTVLTSPTIITPVGCDEAIASWNAVTPGATGVRVEARARYPEHDTRFYTLGLWTQRPGSQPRESVRGQRDEDGQVATDTLVLAQRAWRLQLRMTLTPDGELNPTVTFVGVSYVDAHAPHESLPPNREAWSRMLAVPQRSQLDYPGGEQSWCSPTCLSMVLSFWADRLDRRDLARDVPEVAAGVMDPQWPGTGNWPFNTAYAGSFPGMRAYVTRLSDVAEIEDWIADGIPVVASVDYGVLRGRPPDPTNGHLVVVVGFTHKGDPILNDPGSRLEKRKVFARADFTRAWAVSRYTVYLVHPLTARVPADRFKHWFR